jgi:branched-subunit amino acid transport protein
MTHRSSRVVQTLKVFALIVAGYVLLGLPAAFWPQYLDSPVGLVYALPFLSVYLFHAIGVPGLLQNNGACGWGWCSPTTFGWVFIVGFWLGVAWLLAKLIVRLRHGPRR